MLHQTKAIMALIVLLSVVSVLPCIGADIFRDGFEPSINAGFWPKGPADWNGAQGHEELKGDTSHLRTPGINSAREYVNYRVTYNCQHSLGSYQSDIYLKCWMFEDNDIAFPGYYSENLPNGYITLVDTNYVNDFFRIGVMGEYGRNRTTKVFFQNCSIETAMEGYKALDGLQGRPLVPRAQGWRKYTITLHPYTGTAGDVKFYIDDRLVYNGLRMNSPTGGAAPVDTIIIGSKWWTYETYWYDQVDFGTIETAIPCSTIAEAKSKADGTWVDLAPKVTGGRFTRSPFPGYLAVEEDDRSGGLWVSTSYPAYMGTTANEAEKIQIKGIMRTNEAGSRYLDAIQITQAQAISSQPSPVGCALNTLSDPNTDGMLVKVWGKVTGRGQERNGDWRRYILIDDGSSNAPIKCYYDNIISGVDPVPNVQTGDYVSVIGAAGSEVLFDGAAAQTSVWIRKAGDLVLLRAAGG